MKEKLSGFAVFVLAILSAFGIYVAGPKPKPTPSPTVEPGPLPGASTVPIPLPTPPPATPAPSIPGIALCRLPASTGLCDWHPQGRSEFEEDVFMAQETAKRDFLTPDGRVKDEALYTNEVARLLRMDGYCAINGREGGHTSDDEVWVKQTNSRSDHFDIIRSDGVPITLFASRCQPAKF